MRCMRSSMRCVLLWGAGCIARAWRRMRARRQQERRSAAAVVIQAAVRGLAALRRVAQLQRERSALRSRNLCGAQETPESCSCLKQRAEVSNGTMDALPARSSCSSEAAYPSGGKRVADPADGTVIAADSRACAAEPEQFSCRSLPVCAVEKGASAGADVVAAGTTPPAVAGLNGHGCAYWGGTFDPEAAQQHAAAATECQEYQGQSPSRNQPCEASPCSMPHAHAACKTPQSLQLSQRHASFKKDAHAVDCCAPSSSQQRPVSVLHASIEAINMPVSHSARCDTTHMCPLRLK